MSFLQKFVKNRTRIKKLVQNYNRQVATSPIDLVLLQNLTKNRQTVAAIFLTTCSAELVLANLRFRIDLKISKDLGLQIFYMLCVK